jgi:cytochrome P450
MRRVVTGALEEAGRLGAEEATPEHLLLSIARDPESAAAFMLEHAGVAPATIEKQLDASSSRGKTIRQRAPRFSEAALRVLEASQLAADTWNHHHVGTEHIALALTQTNGTDAAAFLAREGFTHDRAESALRAWYAQGMPRRRHGVQRVAVRSPALRMILRPLRWVARYPTLAWNVYVRKSVGHPKFVTDPYPLYRRLREQEPVRRDPLAPVWILTRYDDTFAMLRDPRFKKDPFASIRLPPQAREQLDVPMADAFRASLETVSMLFLDPPEHTRIRSIFTKTFTPRRIENLRPRMQRMCDEILDRAAARGPHATLELMSELAAPLPVTVIAELLGFPPADYAKIKKWSDEMADALGLNPTLDQQAAAQRAREEMRKYFDVMVEHLRTAPGDNLLSALLAPEVEVMNPDELFANSVLLLAAGHETTTNLIGNGMLALLRHPAQLDDLRKHPEIIGSAIEELLRFDPPVQWTSRVAGETVEMRGQQLNRGDIVLASVGSANRDPAVFKNPDTLDLRRQENRHLSFGTGIHFCLGAALARMEAEIVIGTLVRRFPNLKLLTRRPRWRKGITFRGVHSLELGL